MKEVSVQLHKYTYTEISRDIKADERIMTDQGIPIIRYFLWFELKR